MALIVGATLLPFGAMEAAQIPPAWCLRCGDLWLADVISNVALFVPFGMALSLRGVRWSRVLLLSASLSVFVETMQYLGLPPGRSPAVADLLTNTFGGGLGALLVRAALAEWARTAQRSTQHAVLLAGAWSVGAVLLFVLTGVALQPPAPAANAPAFALETSPFKHVPKHGWYEGLTDSAVVNGARIRRGWSGPIISQVTRPALPLQAAVWVRSTDPLWGQIPLLFLHLPNDSSAWLQLAKQGNSAELSVYRRAWGWGLRVPSLRVPNAFAGRTIGDMSTLGVYAQVSATTLQLRTVNSAAPTSGSGDSAARGDSVSLALTPLLGWALIQPVFGVQSPLAWAAQFGWLLALLFPVGWFSARAPRPVAVLAGAGGVVLLTLALLPRAMPVHPLSPWEWGQLLVALALGHIAAVVLRKNQVLRAA